MYAYRNPYEDLPGAIERRAVRRAGYREARYDTGVVRLNYVVGSDNGPPLVLLPAQTGTWQSYERVLPALARRHRVYAVDLRGHGKSTWTPGDYSWTSVGGDVAAFLAGVVGSPSIVSGNSSGGLVALWCAANVPDRVSGVVLEDAPVFSAEMPRFRAGDRYVYQGLRHAVAALEDFEHRDLADYLRGQTLPVSETRERRMPDWFVGLLSRRLRADLTRRPDQPVRLRGFPWVIRTLFRSLSMFDPDFARAFVDGRFYDGLDHAEALARVRCPLLVLHGDWRRFPEHGLVGAMDDEDAARIRGLVPHAEYRRIAANHVIHAYRPRRFVAALDEFSGALAR